MVKSPKCKFRIKVGNKYTYICGEKEITFKDKEFEEWDDSCRFFKSSFSKAKRNKANPVIIEQLKENIKECESNIQTILSNVLNDNSTTKQGR